MWCTDQSVSARSGPRTVWPRGVSSLDRHVNQQLKQSSGLSHTQYGILMGLYRADGNQMHMSELAEAMGESKSGITYQVTQLERAGLVERQPCQHHERGVHAVLTKAGRTKVRAAVPGHFAMVRMLLIEHLTPQEQEDLSNLLAKIVGKASSLGPTPRMS